MLVSTSHRLAYLALPKTGTSSLEEALAPLCDIRYVGAPRVKHMTLRTFERFVAPYLDWIGVPSVETVMCRSLRRGPSTERFWPDAPNRALSI